MMLKVSNHLSQAIAVMGNDLSLGRGLSGALLLFATLGEEEIAHRYVLKIKEVIEAVGLYDLSLFNGVSGICFALQQASFGGRRYQKMLASLQDFLLGRIEEIHHTDVIRGISGVGRYLLETPHLEYVERIATRLISKNPSTDFGLAHGIPGILAFLSIAVLKGVVVNGQMELISQMSTLIRERPSEKTRDGWCYGIPGVSRALFLAGKALGDEKLKSYAGAAFREVFTRSPEEWVLPSPMLCHGISGLAMITLEMAKEPGYEDLSVQARKLYEMLVASHEIRSLSFLEGSVGVALTLLSFSNPSLNWHIPLMIHE